MRTFYLLRHADVSGVSGTGIVAEGVRFSNGKVVITWKARVYSLAVYDSLDDAVAVHGHDGKTEFVFDDGQPL